MLFSGDRDHGADPSDLYNCRCGIRTAEKEGIEAEPRQMRVQNPVYTKAALEEENKTRERYERALAKEQAETDPEKRKRLREERLRLQKQLAQKTEERKSITKNLVVKNMSYQEWVEWKEKTNQLAKAYTTGDDVITWPGKGIKITADEFKAIRDYAESKGIKLSKFNNSDVDMQLAIEVIDAADEVLQVYPKLHGMDRKLFTIELNTAMHPNDFAQVSESAPHILQLNADAFRNAAALATEYGKLANDSWFVKGTTYKSIVYHELGHMISDVYGIDGLEVIKSVLGTESNTEVLLWCTSNLSQYAAYMGGEEIISEMYSAFFGLENPSEKVVDFVCRCDMIITKGGSDYDS